MQLLGPDGAAVPLLAVDTRGAGGRLVLAFGLLAPGTHTVRIDAAAVRDRAGNPLGTGPLEVAYTVANAQNDWIGSSGNWSNPANWSLGRLPQVGDSVTLDAPGDVTITYDLSTPTQILNLRTVNRFVLSGNGPLLVTQTTDLSGSVDWRLGELRLAGTATLSGTLNLTSNGIRTLTGTLTNTGTVLQTAGILALNGVLVNVGTLEIQAGNVTAVTGATGIVTNAGALRKTGTAASVLSARLDNVGGTIDVQGSQLDLSGSGILDALTATVNAGATLRLSGTNLRFSGVSALNGAGTTSLAGVLSADAGATVNLNGASTLSGTLAGAGNFVNAATLTWLSGTLSGTFTNTGTLSTNITSSTRTVSGTLSNAGTLTTPGPFGLANGANVVNQAGATWAWQSGVFVSGTSGAVATLTNAGTLRKTGTAFTSTNARFEHTGTLELLGGTLSLDGGGTLAGTVTVGTGSELRTAGAATLNLATVTITGTGLFTLAGSTSVTADATPTLNLTGAGRFVLSAGTLAGPGPLTNLGNALFNGGTIAGTLNNQATLTIGTPSTARTISGTLANTGLVLAQGTLNVTTSGRIENQAGGVWELQAGVFNSGVGPFGGFFNAGTLRKTGTLSSVVTISLDTTGTVEVGSNTLTLGGGGTIAGTVTIGTGATLQLSSANLTVAGAFFSGTGTVTLSSGTLTIPAGTTATTQMTGVFSFNAGTLAGAGQLVNTGNFAISSSSAVRTLAGSLTNTGTVTVGSSLTLANGTLANQTGGTLELVSGSINQLAATTNTVTNAGLLRKTSTASIAIQSAASSSGTVRIEAGTLNFTGGLTQSAGVIELLGGQLGLSGAGLVMNGGTLAGAGTVTGVVNNVAGTVAPGTTSSFGTLTFTGPYTQGAAGTLAIDLGGTTVGSFDRVVLSGTGGNGVANLNGTLSVALANGFEPSVGATFVVFTFASRVGTFANFVGLDAPADPNVFLPTLGTTNLTLAVTG